MRAQLQLLQQERYRQEESVAHQPPKSVVGDDEPQDADLSFLADFPTPLTARQRHELTRHADHMDRNHTRLKRAYDALQRAVTDTSSKKEACLKRLAELSETLPAPPTSVVPPGVKRERVDEPAQKEPAAAPMQRPQIGMKARVGGGPLRGGLGVLNRTLATIQRETQATADLQQQRQEVRRKAEQDALQSELVDIGNQLRLDEERIAEVNAKLAPVAEAHARLQSLVLRLEEEEAAYAAAFSLTASSSWAITDRDPWWAAALSKVGLGSSLLGGLEFDGIDRILRFGATNEADAIKLAAYKSAKQDAGALQDLKSKWCGASGGSIHFTLSANTEDTRAQIAAQIEEALPRYLAFRDEADPHLVQIDQLRAERDERMRQQHTFEEEEGDEDPYWTAETQPLMDLEGCEPQYEAPPQQGVLPLPEPEGTAELEDAPFDY